MANPHCLGHNADWQDLVLGHVVEQEDFTAHANGHVFQGAVVLRHGCRELLTRLLGSQHVGGRLAGFQVVYGRRRGFKQLDNFLLNKKPGEVSLK